MIMLQSLIAFIFVFGVIVIIHESGHFIAAKNCGVLVREFAIGFGPKLFQTHKNETTYTIRVLPLGGYVMLAGDEEEEDLRPGMFIHLELDNDEQVSKINLTKDEMTNRGLPFEVVRFDLVDDLTITGHMSRSDELITYHVRSDALIVREEGTIVQIAPRDRQLESKPVWQRLMINFAGPAFNFILSIIVFSSLAFMAGGVPSSEPILGEFQADSPIGETSLEVGDRIQSVNDQSVNTWSELVQEIQKYPEETITLTAEKSNGEIVTDQVTPDQVQTEDGQTFGQIGVQVYMETDIWSKIKYGFIQTWMVMTLVVKTLGQMVTGALGMEQLGGPIAILATTSEVTRVGGISGIISLIAVLSANIGLMNLLPIPGLDGGKILFNMVEAVRGKPISRDIEIVITMIGVFILLGLMIFVTWQDLTRFVFK